MADQSNIPMQDETILTESLHSFPLRLSSVNYYLTGRFRFATIRNYSGTLFSLIFQNMSIEFGTKSDEVSLRCLR